MKHFCGRIVAILAVFSLLLASAGPAAEVARKVAVFPFQINAPQDLSYLQEGILDMLASRLYWEGKVEVLEKQVVREALVEDQGVLNEARAREVGGLLGADYVLFGSLTVFGESVSIDAKMVPLTTEKEPVTAYAQTKGMDEVIPRINDFAQDINNKIFGRGVAAAAAAPPAPRFSQEHPEKLLSGAGPSAAPSAPAQEGGSSFVRLQPAPSEGGGSDVWRSQKLEFPVNGMDVGDLDGDGRPEIVVLGRFREVFVYQWVEGRLLKRGSFEASANDRLVWVCLFDANYDGRAEVYVSNVRNEILSSFVLGWEGGKLVQLATKQKWYFNRVSLPGKGEVLVGQKKTPEEIFMAGIYQLQCTRAECTPLEALKVPSKANVFNFAKADLTGNGRLETVLVGYGDYLYLMDDSGEQLWRSRDYFGATANLLPGKKSLEDREMTRGATGGIEPESVSAYYIPSQLLVVDLNGDERPEILANRNVSFVSRLLVKIRNFSDAQIQSLVWSGYELVPQWKTRPLRGMVVSYHLADVDGDGADELVAAVALDKEMLKKSKSMLFVYELGEVRTPAPAGSTAPAS